MRNVLLLTTFILLFFGCSTAQFPYSTSNKKAIHLFELGEKAPKELMDPSTGAYDFLSGIDYLNKAIEKDSNFWEAHLLNGEFNEIIRNYKGAIYHYKRALEIDPNHSISGSTVYRLATCQMAIADYDGALKNCEVYLKNPNAKEENFGTVRRMQDCANFAKYAISHPKPFEPKNIGASINTHLSEYYPTITVDGKTFLFTRRLVENLGGNSNEQEDFYISHQNDGFWSPSYPMPRNVNTPYNEGAPTISPDGKSLIFVACTDESGVDYGENRQGKGSCDLFITQQIGKKWSNPINLPGKVNSSHWETQPSLSADGKTLYFIRGLRSRDGKKDSDIYVAHLLADGSWSVAEPLPPHINSNQNEESVLIHPDGKTLYFASRGHVGMGGLDLYVSRMDAKGNWGVPQNLGYPINTLSDENSLMVSPEGDIAYFASDRPGGFGLMDIYYFELPKEDQPIKTLYFDGMVYDAKTNAPLGASFQLTNLSTGQLVIQSKADASDGTFLVPLPINSDYAIEVNHPGYLPYSLNFNMTLKENEQSYHLMIPLNSENSSTENILTNVFFDLNQAKLRPESIVELTSFANYLKAHAQLKIEIGGHTDSRGNAQDNLTLSTNRAKAVYEFLISKGVSSDRLTYKGYGSSSPIITDTAINALSSAVEKEKAHQKNRRTTYIIRP
ncbi:MAG: OmpA family protein [Crocinitomicaceae bacterium]|nr:OmpA family protein [Crocinitomicaceae bacterium]